MKFYRVTTTFLGADAPSHFYFDTAEKAESFLEKECQNGLYEPVEVLSKTKVIVLQPEGWITTKSLGDVYVNEYGNVVRSVTEEGQRSLYPYRAIMVHTANGWKQDGWDNCSGNYKPSYLARLMREGKAKWA